MIDSLKGWYWGQGFIAYFQMDLTYSFKNGVACGRYDPLAVGAPLDSKSPLVIYPNPANDELTITFPAGASNSEILVDLIAVNGMNVYHHKGSERSVTINVQDLPQGLYLLRTQLADNINTKKISIIH